MSSMYKHLNKHNVHQTVLDTEFKTRGKINGKFPCFRRGSRSHQSSLRLRTQPIQAAQAPLPESFFLKDQILIDLRSNEEFCQGHLAGSTNIPADELASRVYELPPKYCDTPLELFGHPAELLRARDLLTEQGWRVAGEAALWDCEAESSWARAEVEVGSLGRRLWQPSEFLQEILPQATGALTAVHHLLPSRPVAIDVGCGSGRDAVFLALELGPSWDVIAIDNHTKALDRADELARREGVNITCVDRDLRKHGLSDMRAHMVHGSRFLCRPLFPEIHEKVLQPGGVFIWSHFLEGCEKLAPPRRPSRQLQSGELRETFIDGAGFIPIHDEEGQMTTRSQDVPAAFFAAQRPH